MLLQVLFRSQIASEAGSFTIDDVLEQLADKLIRRHPARDLEMGGGRPDPDELPTRWSRDGKRSNARNARLPARPDSVLDGVPQTLPAPPEGLPNSSTRLSRRLRLDPLTRKALIRFSERLRKKSRKLAHRDPSPRVEPDCA